MKHYENKKCLFYQMRLVLSKGVSTPEIIINWKRLEGGKTLRNARLISLEAFPSSSYLTDLLVNGNKKKTDAHTQVRPGLVRPK